MYTSHNNYTIIICISHSYDSEQEELGEGREGGGEGEREGGMEWV